jgi:hypothetical protein
MAQYSVGNISLIQNSATVYGASMDWLTASNVKIGDLFKKQGENAWYQVTSVNLATNLNISPVYAAASVAGVSYLIVRDFTPNYDWPEISGGDYDWQDAYTRAMRAIDNQVAVVAAAGDTPTVQFVTASYHIQSADTFVIASMSIGTPASCFLPDASTARKLRFACATGDMIVIASGSDTIEGNATIGMYTNNDTAMIHSDGLTTWYIF